MMLISFLSSAGPVNLMTKEIIPCKDQTAVVAHLIYRCDALVLEQICSVLSEHLVHPVECTKLCYNDIKIMEFRQLEFIINTLALLLINL